MYVLLRLRPSSLPFCSLAFTCVYADARRERECLTDNGNRTLHQIREILNEHRCVDGSVSLSLFWSLCPDVLGSGGGQRAVRNGSVYVPT